MTGISVFLAIFLAVLLFLFGLFLYIRYRIRRFSNEVFGTEDVRQVFENIETTEQEKPKSLNGMDMLYLPQIQKDFPDFNPTMADNYAKEALKKHVGKKEGFHVHNVVIAGYEKTSVEYNIIMQAAAEWKEQGKKVQKRFILHYSYLIKASSGEEVVAANCPNCGGAIESLSWEVCPYCDSRLVNVLKNSWKFIQIREG